MEELSNSPQKIDLGTELDQLYTKSKVDLHEKLDETLSLDGFLWKLMLSLLETRQSGDCAPLLSILTAVFNKITGQKRQTPSMSPGEVGGARRESDGEEKGSPVVLL